MASGSANRDMSKTYTSKSFLGQVASLNNAGIPPVKSTKNSQAIISNIAGQNGGNEHMIGNYKNMILKENNQPNLNDN